MKPMEDWFTQESGYCKSDEQHYPTVRFYLDKESNIHWERFIDCHQKHKANFHGKYGGMAWVPPDLDLEECAGHQVWIVEGIFDAISLCQNWIPAIATMSSNNIPDQVFEKYKELDIEWVIAFDNDPVNKHTGRRAGLEAAKKLAAFLKTLGEKHTVVFPPFKKDWNDLHLARKLNPKSLEDDFWRGKLHTAKSYRDYGYYLSQRRRHSRFGFNFENVLYGWAPGKKLHTELAELPEDVSEKVKKETTLRNVSITPLSNFSIEFLYCQENKLEDILGYYFRIQKVHGDEKNIAIDSNEIASSESFKKALLKAYSGAWFDGSQTWLNTIAKLDWFDQRIDTVKILPWGGYDSATGCYVFNEIAYDKNGKHYQPNEYDYFDLPDHVKIKTAYEEKYEYSEQFKSDWFDDYFIYFQHNGLAVLSFWLASLFAEQFRELKNDFPFVSAAGVPGAGKSTMLEFLWKLLGRNKWEGIPLNDVSTVVGFYRELGQGSNIPTVFIEGPEEDSDQKKQAAKFNFENFKGCYNGRILRVTGKKTQGNQNIKPKFRSSILVGQNDRIDGTVAIRERFCEFWFTKKHFTDAGLPSAERIASWPVEELCGFRHFILSNRVKIFETLLNNFDSGKRFLLDEAKNHDKGPLKNHRIVQNYAYLLAAGKLLQSTIPSFSDDLWNKYKEFIMDQALERQEATSQDSWLVQQFFETFEYFESDGLKVNHSANPDEFIAVNLNEFFEFCRDRGQTHFKDVKQLKRNLRTSKEFKFLEENKAVKSYHTRKATRCWVFKRPAPNPCVPNFQKSFENV